MARISTEKDLEMLRKNSDGTYTKYNPQTKAKNVKMSNGKTVESELADNAKKISTAQGKANSAYEKAEQAFQSASNGKTQIASAITGKGVSASSSDTFDTLVNKIKSISTGKKWAIGSAQVIREHSSYPLHITVNGLNFKPRNIILFARESDSHFITFVYSKDQLFGNERVSQYEDETFSDFMAFSNNTAQTNCTLTSDGFDFNPRYPYNIKVYKPVYWLALD